jgi:hypothetical protein
MRMNFDGYQHYRPKGRWRMFLKLFVHFPEFNLNANGRIVRNEIYWAIEFNEHEKTLLIVNLNEI